MRECTIPGCAGRHMAHGWCNMHYQRVRKYGSLDRPARRDGRRRKTPEQAAKEARRIADYTMYKSWGWNDCSIADTWGIRLGSLQIWKKRKDIQA